MRNSHLVDRFGRTIDYLRLSVTDRCDLRCTYCRPPGRTDYHEPLDWLGFGELERIVAALARLGVRRVRLTGGEPLLRRDLPRLAERLAALPGIEDLSLSTNAIRLAPMAARLRKAGVGRVNISLDTLEPGRYREVTGGGDLARVLAGIEAARTAGMAPIRINTVVMRGVNDRELPSLVAYCMERNLTLRLIETMPVGDGGRAAAGRFLALDTVRRRILGHLPLVPDIAPGGGPARYYRIDGTDARIGFITPLSQHFCATCNRVRLDVTGNLLLCLGQEHSVPLGRLLRAGVSDAGLEEALRGAMALKPERHEFREQPAKVLRRMSMTGG